MKFVDTQAKSERLSRKNQEFKMIKTELDLYKKYCTAQFLLGEAQERVSSHGVLKRLFKDSEYERDVYLLNKAEDAVEETYDSIKDLNESKESL